MDDLLLKLTNPPVKIEWDGVVYTVHKATLTKVAELQTKIRTLSEGNEPDADAKMSAYALYLILKDAEPAITGLTEEKISTSIQGDIDTTELLVKLGFLSPLKMETALEKLTSDSSLSQSPTEQDGDQKTSQS